MCLRKVQGFVYYTDILDKNKNMYAVDVSAVKWSPRGGNVTVLNFLVSTINESIIVECHQTAFNFLFLWPKIQKWKKEKKRKNEII